MVVLSRGWSGLSSHVTERVQQGRGKATSPAPGGCSASRLHFLLPQGLVQREAELWLANRRQAGPPAAPPACQPPCSLPPSEELGPDKAAGGRKPEQQLLTCITSGPPECQERGQK